MRDGELLAIAKGKVQGVGFRRTAKAIADQLNLAGTVCNLQSGGVEIFAQGEKSRLDQFLHLLQKEFPAAKIEASFKPCSKKRSTVFKII